MPELLIYREDQRENAQLVWPGKASLSGDTVQETFTYRFELRNVDDVFAPQLCIDELPLQALRPPDSKTALWSWQPGFYAGAVEAELTVDGREWHRFEIVTDPDLRKMTRQQFDTMVHELLNDTFALFAISSFKKGISRSASGAAPPIARLEFLRSRIQELESTVNEINRHPQRVLRSQTVAKPYYRAKRVTGAEIMRSFRGGNVQRSSADSSKLPERLNGYLPRYIQQQVAHSALDIREHREIKACLRGWASWLRHVSALLRGRGEHETDHELRRLRSVWARRTLQMSRTLIRLLALPLFQSISEEACRPRLSPIYRHVPAYRRFFRLYRDFNAGLANVFGDFLQMPLARTFELYELWCYLRLVRAAQKHVGVKPEQVDKLFGGVSPGGVTVTAGAVCVLFENGVSLCFQRRFREYWEEESGQGSFSREMIPDFTVVIPRAEGGARLIVLDAKYRIENNINTAIGSIHMYRDALVEEQGDGNVYGVVTGAYLLSPYLPHFGKANWRDASLPGRLFHPKYRDTFRFGAATLQPGMPLLKIWETLEAILKDAAGT